MSFYMEGMNEMKRIFSVLLTACLLFGVCGCEKGEEPKKEKPLQAVDFTIERDDFSVKDEDGNYILEAYYETVHIENNTKVANKINKALKEEAKSFKESAKDAAEVAKEMQSLGRVHKYYSQAEVVTNEKGILSIRFVQNVYSGGAHEVDNIWGINFNLATGEKLTLEEIFSMPEERVVQYLKDKTREYAEEPGNYGVRAGVDAFLDGYEAEDFSYYIENGKLYLCYGPDELAPRMMGTVIIECAI